MFLLSLKTPSIQDFATEEGGMKYLSYKNGVYDREYLVKGMAWLCSNPLSLHTYRSLVELKHKPL